MCAVRMRQRHCSMAVDWDEPDELAKLRAELAELQRDYDALLERYEHAMAAIRNDIFIADHPLRDRL